MILVGGWARCTDRGGDSMNLLEELQYDADDALDVLAGELINDTRKAVPDPTRPDPDPDGGQMHWH